MWLIVLVILLNTRITQVTLQSNIPCSYIIKKKRSKKKSNYKSKDEQSQPNRNFSSTSLINHEEILQEKDDNLQPPEIVANDPLSKTESHASGLEGSHPNTAETSEPPKSDALDSESSEEGQSDSKSETPNEENSQYSKSEDEDFVLVKPPTLRIIPSSKPTHQVIQRSKTKSEPLTKKQRENQKKREKEKELKRIQEDLQKQRLAQYRRQQEAEYIKRK